MESSDISVVIQGPVLGSGGSSSPRNDITARAIRSVRSHLPSAEIIFSTWEGTDCTDLHCDKLVFSKDPGACITNFKEWIANNGNRQITSTLAGIRAASRPYILKWRSDLLMLNTGFLDSFTRFPKRFAEWRVFQERIVVCALYTFTTSPRLPTEFAPRPYHVSDWVSFGLASDMLFYWDIPHTTEPENSLFFTRHASIPGDRFPWQLWQFSPEQSNTLSALAKYAPGRIACAHKLDCSQQNARESNRIIVNNFIVLDCCDYGLYSLKLKIDQARLGPLDLAYLMDHSEWAKLYKQYCDNQYTPQVTHNEFRSAWIAIKDWQVGYKRLPFSDWLRIQRQNRRVWKPWMWPVGFYLALILPLIRIPWSVMLIGWLNKRKKVWPAFDIGKPQSPTLIPERTSAPLLSAISKNASQESSEQIDELDKCSAAKVLEQIIDAASSIFAGRGLHLEAQTNTLNNSVDFLIKKLNIDNRRICFPAIEISGALTLSIQETPLGYDVILRSSQGHFDCRSYTALEQSLEALGLERHLQTLSQSGIHDGNMLDCKKATLQDILPIKPLDCRGLIREFRTRSSPTGSGSAESTRYTRSIKASFPKPADHHSLISFVLTTLATFVPSADY
jgi:hypothetical protein